MKNLISSNVLEHAKRMIFSFQVLIIGIAIPVLFIIGVSNNTENKTQDTQTKEISNTTQLSPRPVVGFTFPMI
jgi:hypothetical protein